MSQAVAHVRNLPVQSVEQRWVRAIELLLLPSLITAGGAAVLWSGIALGALGVREIEFSGRLQLLFGGLCMFSLLVAAIGSVVGPQFWVIAALVAGASARSHGLRVIRTTGLLIVLGLVGILAAWAGLPALL